MAILKGIEAWVSSNGQHLQEITDNTDTVEGNSGNEVTRYIEAVAGANFSVHCKADRTFKAANPNVKTISYVIFVDGIERGRWAPADGEFSLEKDVATSYQNGQAHTSKFLFSEIDRKNAPASKTELSRLIDTASKVGIIEVRAWRASGFADLPHKWNLTQARAVESFPEKALKGSAVSHCARLGNPQLIGKAPATARHCTYIDSFHGTPFVTFRFKYRSHRALQIERLIPEDAASSENRTSPTLTPDDAGSTLAAYSTEDLRRIIEARENGPNRADRRVKQEALGAKNEAGSGRRIKRERDAEVDEMIASARPVKKKKVPKSQVIDLSED